MASLILALLLMMSPGQAEATGELQLLGDPGLSVLVDGMEYGKTMKGGLVIEIPAGDRKVTIRTASGEENTFDVKILPNQRTELTVSALGLKRALKRPQNGAVRIRGAGQCFARVAGLPATRQDDSLLANEIPAGDAQVTVDCNGRTAQKRVSIRTGTMTNLSLDKKTMTLSAAGEERLSLSVEVNEYNAITAAAIPAAWKRSLSRVNVPGVKVESVAQLSNAKLAMRARSASEYSLYSYRWAIGEAVGVQAVENYRIYKYGSDHLLDMIVTMEPAR